MKIQLKRSSVLDGGAAKEPTASQMEYGELAVNYSETDPAIFLKDAADNIIRISGVGNISDDGQVEVPSTVNPPPNPSDGNLWYNADDGRLYVYYNDGNSTQWVDASPDGWNIQEAIGGFVKKAGDNMTGDLTFDTDKITLAADGSITAAGNILVGNISASASSTGGYIYSTRYIDAANVGSAALNGQAADGDLASLSIIDRSSGSGVETVVIKPTGSGSFAGGASVAGGSEIRVGDGQAAFAVNDGYGTGIFAGSALILQNASKVQTVNLASETGSAEFKGDVETGGGYASGGGCNLFTNDAGTADERGAVCKNT